MIENVIYSPLVNAGWKYGVHAVAFEASGLLQSSQGTPGVPDPLPFYITGLRR